MTFDGKAFGQEIVGAVKAHMDKALSPILERIAALEARTPEKGEKGEPGASGTDGRDGVDGRDGTDGKDGEKGADGERGPEGPAGKDADPITPEQVREAILAMPEAIAEAVAAYIKANPPANGRDGADGKDGRDGEKGEPGKDGRDGLDLKDLFRADGGRLMAVMSDGTTKDLGEFVGKNGADGAPGRDGADGKDGVGFDDMDLVVADDGAALVFTRGDEKKAFALPVVIDCGVYKQGKAYRKGNGVTWGGSFWIAQKDNPAGKPDAADGDWRLAVKKGQNGKDAEKGGA